MATMIQGRRVLRRVLSSLVLAIGLFAGIVGSVSPAGAVMAHHPVAGTYQAMGLLARDRPTNYYDPGNFWSGDALQLAGHARLGAEIRVHVPLPMRQLTPRAEPV